MVLIQYFLQLLLLAVVTAVGMVQVVIFLPHQVVQAVVEVHKMQL